MDNDEYDFLFKIVIIGDSGVGKTNLISQYIDSRFSLSSKTTVGVEFKSKILTVNQRRINVQLWDTAGQERFRAITSVYYRGAKGAVVVYAIDNEESFKSVEHWLKDLRSNGDKDLPIMLLANKSDLEEKRAVKKDEGMTFAKGNSMLFYETSALNGNNIEAAFKELIETVYKINKAEIEEEDEEDINENNESDNISTHALDLNNNVRVKRKCC